MKLNCLLLLWFSAVTGAGGEEIRISFLDTPAARSNAISFLSSQGCSTSGLSAVAKAIEHYYSTSNTFDTSHFPPRINDGYTFSSTRQLVDALPYHPARTPHAYEMNCFDFVTLLLEDNLETHLLPDQCAAIFLAPYSSDGTEIGCEPMPTPRYAFMTSYPDSYREFIASMTGRPYSDKRISLTATIDSCTPFPRSLRQSQDDLALIATSLLHGTWLGQQFSIPTNSPLILIHEAYLNAGFMHTTHAGLLYHSGRRYSYFQKCGGAGPFMRMELEEPAQIQDYHRGLAQFDDARTNKIFLLGIGNGALQKLDTSTRLGSPDEKSR